MTSSDRSFGIWRFGPIPHKTLISGASKRKRSQTLTSRSPVQGLHDCDEGHQHEQREALSEGDLDACEGFLFLETGSDALLPINSKCSRVMLS